MYAIHGLFERWGAFVTGIVLVALPVGGWAFGRPFNPMDVVIGGIGIGALLVAVDGFLRQRELARHERKRSARRRTSVPLAEGG
jgi:hypothetical protein